jgi:hypothetical protein
MTTSIIGKSVPRPDAYDKVTGGTKYDHEYHRQKCSPARRL